MEDYTIILAANITQYRKRCSLTQETLAAQLGVTFQAVSKWETAKSAPDITLLPRMAEVFGCYIDQLFGREVKTEIHYDHCGEFPWPDDTVLRGIVCEGRKILAVDDHPERFTFCLTGEAKNVECRCNLELKGTVSGNVTGCINPGGSIHIGGDVGGDVSAFGNVKARDVRGGVTCRTLNCSHIEGNITIQSQ